MNTRNILIGIGVLGLGYYTYNIYNHKKQNDSAQIVSTTIGENAQIKKEVNNEFHQHLSTIFVGVGIVSFTLGAIVNYATITRLYGGVS